MGWELILILGILIGIIVSNSGVVFRKLLAIKSIHFGVDFVDDEPKRIQSDHNKQLND